MTEELITYYTNRLTHAILSIVGVLIVIVSFSEISVSQDIVPYRINDKWGFSNLKGKLVIPIKYDEVSNFNRNNQAEVRQGEMSFCINIKGKKVQCIAESIGYCGGVHFIKSVKFNTYKESGKVGIIIPRLKSGIHKLNDLYVYDSIPAIWDELLINKNGGLIAANGSGKWGIINNKGKNVIKYKYDNIEISNNDSGYFISKNSGIYGLIDNKGNIIIEPKYLKIEFLYRKNIIKVWTEIDKWGYINKKGKEYFEDR